MKAIAITAGVTLLVLIIGLAALEVMRRRGFDPVRALSRPFDPSAPDAAATTAVDSTTAAQ